MKPLMLGAGQLLVSHNQWIALTHSDWLLKLRISFAIHASVHRLNLIISEPRLALTVLVSSWSSLLFIIFDTQIENSKET